MSQPTKSPEDAAHRLFFAAQPDLVTCARIDAAAATLNFGDGAKRVRADHYHLTLAFVGCIGTSQLPLVQQIGRALRMPGFSLRFDGYEYWPKPEVAVLAARIVPTDMQALWAQLHSMLAVHGWALDAKRLRPHVTVARKVAQAPVFQAMLPFAWAVDAVALMRTESQMPGGAYTVVDTWALLDSVEKT